MMANHGVATVAPTISEAYDLLYYVERVAQVQIYAMWTQRPLHVLPQNVIDETIEEFRTMKPYGGKKPHVLALRGAQADARQERAGLQELTATQATARASTSQNCPGLSSRNRSGSISASTRAASSARRPVRRSPRR